eukprot:6207913-Pleurochrysis_carterae.AAC.4
MLLRPVHVSCLRGSFLFSYEPGKTTVRRFALDNRHPAPSQQAGSFTADAKNREAQHNRTNRKHDKVPEKTFSKRILTI